MTLLLILMTVAAVGIIVWLFYRRNERKKATVAGKKKGQLIDAEVNGARTKLYRVYHGGVPYYYDMNGNYLDNYFDIFVLLILEDMVSFDATGNLSDDTYYEETLNSIEVPGNYRVEDYTAPAEDLGRALGEPPSFQEDFSPIDAGDGDTVKSHSLDYSNYDSGYDSGGYDSGSSD